MLMLASGLKVTAFPSGHHGRSPSSSGCQFSLAMALEGGEMMKARSHQWKPRSRTLRGLHVVEGGPGWPSVLLKTAENGSRTSRRGPDEVMDALLGRQQGQNLGMDPQVDVRTSGHPGPPGLFSKLFALLEERANLRSCSTSALFHQSPSASGAFRCSTVTAMVVSRTLPVYRDQGNADWKDSVGRPDCQQSTKPP